MSFPSTLIVWDKNESPLRVKFVPKGTINGVGRPCKNSTLVTQESKRIKIRVVCENTGWQPRDPHSSDYQDFKERMGSRAVKNLFIWLNLIQPQP